MGSTDMGSALMRRRLNRLILAAVVAGAAVLTFNSIAPQERSQPAGRSFWDTLTPQGSEQFLPQSLDEVANAADAVALARVAGIEEGRAAPVEDATPGVLPPLRTFFVHLKVDRVVAGAISADEQASLVLEMPRPETADLPALQAELPKGQLLFFLCNSGARAAAAGQGDAVQQRERRIWYPTSSRGILSADEQGLLVSLRPEARPSSYLQSFRATTVVEAADRARQVRQRG